MKKVNTWFEELKDPKLWQFLKTHYKDFKGIVTYKLNDEKTLLCIRGINLETEEEYERKISPFGIIQNEEFDLEFAKTFYEFMRKLNYSKLSKDGKTYDEEWQSACNNAVEVKFDRKINILNTRIAGLKYQRDTLQIEKNQLINEIDALAGGIDTQIKFKNNLILKDLLDKMPADERNKFLQDYGYIAVKEESEVIEDCATNEKLV